MLIKMRHSNLYGNIMQFVVNYEQSEQSFFAKETELFFEIVEQTWYDF